MLNVQVTIAVQINIHPSPQTAHQTLIYAVVKKYFIVNPRCLRCYTNVGRHRLYIKNKFVEQMY